MGLFDFIKKKLFGKTKKVEESKKVEKKKESVEVVKESKKITPKKIERKEKPKKKVIRIYLRPSSGRISINHFRSTDAKPDTFSLIAELDRTLRGIDCDISFDYWDELALTDPPWIFLA